MIMMHNAEAATFGSDVRVNDSANAAFVQSAPDMAIDGNTIYVAWEDSRNGNYDIYLVKSTDGGASFGSNVGVYTGLADQTAPAIAVRSSSSVYVAWQDFRNGNWDIYFAKSINGGASFGASVRVDDSTGTSEQSAPAMNVDGAGDIYVVWQDGRSGNWDVYSAVSTDQGASFDANVRVNEGGNPGSSNQRFPTVATNSNDDILVAWQDDRDGDNDIYFTKSTNGGSSFSANNVQVSDDSTGREQTSPTLAINSEDDIYVAWEDFRSGSNWDIYLSKSTNSGNDFKQNVLVNDASTSNQLKPSVFVDTRDGVHVAWYDARNAQNYVYYTKSTDSGNSFGIDSRVCAVGGVASSQLRPVVRVTGSAVPYVAWADFRSGNYDIYFNVGANTAPTCAIANPANGATVSGATTISGSASDPDGNEELVRIEIRVDGGAWNPAIGTASWSYTLNTNTLSNGQHTVDARAYDGVLFSSLSSINLNVNNPSNQPPYVAIWTPLPDSILSGKRAVVAGNASDPNGDSIDYVQVRIDGGGWVFATESNNWAAWVYSLDTTTISSGQHTIEARSYDGALYSDLASVTILVNNAATNRPPTVNISTPANGAKVGVSGMIAVAGSASDPDGNAQLSIVQVKIDNGTWESASASTAGWVTWVYSLNLSTLSAGEHVISARAYDGLAYSDVTQITIKVAVGDGGAGLLWAIIIIALLVVFIIILLLLFLRKRKVEPAQQHPVGWGTPTYGSSQYPPSTWNDSPPQNPPRGQG